jgi:4,5-DOPA dioxygenase extradiol
MSSTRFPVLFVSHGAPSMVLEPSPTRDFLQQLGRETGRPRGIVCVSAHWCTAQPQVTMSPQPATIYDFGGFSDELYRLEYRVPGDPVLGQRVLSLLKEAGIAGGKDMSRGLDHGAWAPLMLMYPEADIPVIELSVQPQLGPEHHLAVGRALEPLREEGVLILASGSATHNLADFFGHDLDAEPLPYAREFAQWLGRAVGAGNVEELLDYQRRAPQARRNHPTPEHLLPIFTALGAAGEAGVARSIHDAFNYAAISMAAYRWD